MARLKLLMPFLLFSCLLSNAHAQQDRAKLVQDDLVRFDQDKFWAYNDLAGGIARAKETGRPLLVVFR